MTDTTTPTLEELLGECRDYIRDAVRDAMNAYGPESLGVTEGETLLAQIEASLTTAAMTEQTYRILEWVGDGKRPAEYERSMTPADAAQFASSVDIIEVTRTADLNNCPRPRPEDD